MVVDHQLLAARRLSSLPTAVVLSSLQKLVVSEEGPIVAVYSTITGLELESMIDTGLTKVFSLACHPERPDFAWAGHGGLNSGIAGVGCASLASGENLHLFHVLKSRGQSVGFSPDGRWIVAGGGAEVYFAVEYPSLDNYREFPGGEFNNHIAFHRDGRTVATTAWSHGDTDVQLCDIETEVVAKLPAGGQENLPEWEAWIDRWFSQCISLSSPDVTGISFSPGGSYIAVSHSCIDIFSYPAKKCIKRLGSNRQSLESPPDALSGDLLGWSNPCFVPDSQLFWCGSRFGELVCWETESWSEVTRFQAHEGRVVSIDISRDGTLLATASSDQSVKLWRIGG